MRVTRRGLLGAGTTGVATSLAGCFGIGGSDVDAEGSGGGSGGSGGGGSNQQQTETATPTPKPDESLPVLVERTAAIFDEVDWYATSYDATIRQFVVLVNPVIGSVEDIQAAAPDVTEEQLGQLTELTTKVANFVERSMVPHFEVPTPLTKGENVYVQQIKLARRRGDERELDAALSRMKLFYEQVISKPFVQNEFPKAPVYDELYSLLAKDENTKAMFGVTYPTEGFTTYAYPDLTEETGTDGVHQHVHEFPSGQRYYTHAHEHDPDHALDDHTNEPEFGRLYGHSENGIDLLEDTKGWRDRMSDYTTTEADVFGPLAAPDRTAELLLTADSITRDFTASALYLQRFPSPEVATSAMEALSDGGVKVEGTTTFAKRKWSQALYQLGDVTVYAFVLQTDQFLIAAAASPRPWGKRTNWSKPFEQSWLAIPPETDQ